MQTLMDMLGHYGEIGIFVLVLLVQLGLPLPVLPVFLLLGSLAADQPLQGLLWLMLAMLGSLIGDYAWFYAGRRYGHRILHLLCRVSLSPDICVRQSEGHFTRYGMLTLVVAKFIPGLAMVAPPLAGVLGLRVLSFVLFSALAAFCWAGIWLLVGAVFADHITHILRLVADVGQIAVLGFALLLTIYIVFLWWRRYRLRAATLHQRIEVTELLALIQAGEPVWLLDVRSSLVQSVHPEHLPDARLIQMTDLQQHRISIPADIRVVTYCSCPNDVSALQAATLLRQQGVIWVKALHGGINAWQDAGLPLVGLAPDLTAAPGVL